MNRQTGHPHRHEDFRHELLQQRFLAHELDATEFSRGIFGDPAETPTQFQSALVRQVDEADDNRESDDVESQ